jgi:hypothetical protein
MPEKWEKEDYYQLARLANPKSSELVKLKVNHNDLVADKRLNELVEAIYETLREEGINYGLESIPRSESRTSVLTYQLVRLPSEIMNANKREGTCLDLALFFSGVCLGYELLPLLIALGDPEENEDNRHVLVAVSLTQDLRNWEDRIPAENSMLIKIPVGSEHADDICRLIKDGAYVAVECTGFARGNKFNPEFPEGLWRETDGTMRFESAKRAGLAHFNKLNGTELAQPNKLRERKFLFAIDYGSVYRYRSLRPVDEVDAGGQTIYRFGAGQSDGNKPEADPLRYIIDRNEQEEALKDAILLHRARAPKRPLVCVIHGDEAECHDNFVNRLSKISLPIFASHWQTRPDPEAVILKERMEVTLRDLTEENWQRVLWGDLAAAFTRVRDASPNSVIDLISRRKPAVMIDVSLLSEELKDVSLKRLDYFFKFWGTLPPLPEDLLLIVCLSLKYQDRFNRGWLRPWVALNDKLRSYIENLAFGDFEGVDGVCLPKLTAITQKDATRSVQHPLAQRYGIYEDEVISLYKRSRVRDKEGRIPMSELLYELRRLSKAA